MLWRRRFVILVPLLLTVIASLVGSMFMEPQYESVATLAFENPMPLTRPLAQATGNVRMDGEEIRVLRKRMLASSFLESVAVQIGLHENPRLQARVDRMAKESPGVERSDLLMRECVSTLTQMLDIRAEGSDIFYVRAVSNSADLAYQVASTVATQYVQTDRQSKLRQSDEAFAFAQEQATIYEEKLDEKRRQLREYEEHAALRPLSSPAVSEATVARVRSLIKVADGDIELLKGRHEAARGKLVEEGLEAHLSLGLLDSPTLKGLRETLYELERNQGMNLVDAQENDPAVASGKSQIASKNQQILRELESIATSAYPSLEPDARQLLVDHEYSRIRWDAAQRRQTAFKDFISKYAADLASVPAEEFRFSRLKEEVEGANRLYQTWQEQAASAHIAKAVQSSAMGDLLVLLEPARLPLEPFAPEKKNILLLSIFMGMALGIGAAILMEYLDLTLKSVEEIEDALELPILGAVPRTQAAVLLDMEVRRKNRMRVLVPATVLTVLALAVASWVLLIQNKAAG